MLGLGYDNLHSPLRVLVHDPSPWHAWLVGQPHTKQLLESVRLELQYDGWVLEQVLLAVPSEHVPSTHVPLPWQTVYAGQPHVEHLLMRERVLLQNNGTVAEHAFGCVLSEHVP